MNKYSRLLVLFFLLAPNSHAQSESSTGNTTVKACGVTFQRPSEVRLINNLGIDSCVREFRGDNIYIVLDVGMGFTLNDDTNFRKEHAKKVAFQLKEAVIDDSNALVISFYEDKVGEMPDEATGMNYVAVLVVPRMGKRQSSMSMYVYGRDPQVQAEAQKIFESIKFLPPPPVEEYKEPDPFALMSDYHRSRLMERLNLFVEFNRKRRWGQVYDLLAPSYREGMLDVDGRQPTKTDWIEIQQRWHSKTENKALINFRFEEAHLIVSEWEQGLRIEGCGEYEGRVNQGARVNAFWEDDEWYFSDIEPIYPRTNCSSETNER